MNQREATNGRAAPAEGRRRGRGALILAFAAAVGLAPVASRAADAPPKEGEELTRHALAELIKRYEAEKTLPTDKRLETIEQFKVYNLPECAKFLVRILPQEKDPTIVRAITVACAVLGTEETVRAAVQVGLPRLESLIAVAEKPDPLVPREWQYRREKDWRYLPEFYFGDIWGLLIAARDDGARAWLARHGLEAPIAKDPLLLKLMLSVIGQVDHADRAKTLAAAARKWKDPQIVATVFDSARRGKVEDAQLARTAAQFLFHKASDVQIASLMFVEKAAPDILRKELPQLLKSPALEVRMLGATAVASSKGDAQLLLPLLDDPEWRVRVAAFSAIGKFATPEAVVALIKRLKVEEHPRALDDLLDTLRRLTGVDLGRFAMSWEGWWKENQAKVKIAWRDAAALGDIKAQKPATGRTASYYGLEIVSNAVCFLLDISKSMNEVYQAEDDDDAEGGTKGRGRTEAVEKDAKKKPKKTFSTKKLDHARESLKKVLARLPQRVQFNIITFSHETRPWRDVLVGNGEDTRTEAYTFLDQLKPAGSTNIFDTVALALSDERVDTIYLLSDGAPTSGAITDPARIVEEVRRLNLFRKVKINTIGFHLDPEAQKLMLELADENFGAYVAK